MTHTDFRQRLRKKAVEILDKEPEKFDSLDKGTMKKLFHELQVHQIELEIQNEELRNIQNTMEANRVRYISLFDNAPVGYVILDNVGIIKQFNNAFYKIVEHNSRMKQHAAFADLMNEASAHEFRSKFRAFLKNPAGKRIEVVIDNGEEDARTVLVELSRHKKVNGTSEMLDGELLVTVTDISEVKKIKTELQHALEELKQIGGLVPICSVCKKIRDDKGFWKSLETFIENYSGTEFTHGMCPECSDRLYGKNEWYRDMKANKKSKKN